MPNPIAWLALGLIIPFAFFAFYRWKPLNAAMIVMFGSAMFMPANMGIAAPVLPDMSKEYLPALGCLMACAVLRRDALQARMFRGPEVLALVASLGTIGTWLTNTDDLTYGPVTLPGIGAYDALNDLVETFLRWFPPFYLGRALVRSGADLRALIRFVVFCGLIYTIPILIELRMSPQLHNWVYGFHQSDFIQTIRFGGYRPKVFMRHGLNVALFMMIATLSAVTMYKAKLKLGRRWWTPKRAAIFLLFILILCKSAGTYIYVAVLLPLLLLGKYRSQRAVALALVVLIVGYPAFRTFDLIPVEWLREMTSTYINEERSLSLWFRLFTEGEVLENARERLLFGWGGYGRPFEFDPVTGEQLSVLDGYWVIELGAHGLVGFLGIFGMVLWPVVQAVRWTPKIENRADQVLVSSCALLVVIYVFDWVPNSSVSTDLTFMVGGLAGGIEGILRTQKQEARAKRMAKRAALRARQAAGHDEAARTEPELQNPLRG